MNAINIRHAEQSDAKTIYQFICELESFKSDQFEVFRHYYEINLPDANKIHLVAVLSTGKIVGYLGCYGQLLLHHMGMVYEIQEMFVDQVYRGSGIGKRLLTAVEEMLKNRPCVSFEVTTNKVRAEALRFYEQNGFVQTHFKLVKEPFDDQRGN